MIKNADLSRFLKQNKSKNVDLSRFMGGYSPPFVPVDLHAVTVHIFS